MTYNKALAGLYLLLLVTLVGFVGAFDANEAEMQQTRYCDMVAAWDATNGQTGWPPYNGREMCE